MFFCAHFKYSSCPRTKQERDITFSRQIPLHFIDQVLGGVGRVPSDHLQAEPLLFLTGKDLQASLELAVDEDFQLEVAGNYFPSQ